MSVCVKLGDGAKSYTEYHHLELSNTCFIGIHPYRNKTDNKPAIGIGEDTLFWFLEPNQKSVSVLIYKEDKNHARIYKYYSDKLYETLNSRKEV